MQLVEDRFRGHLVADESVQDFTAGRLLEDTIRGQAAIGLTDRRLLCLSKAGEFVDVRYDYICSIRSRQRTRVAYPARDTQHRMLHLLGGLLAMAVLGIGVLFMVPAGVLQGAVTTVLAVVTVALAVAVERVRKRSRVARASETVFVGAGVLALLGLVGVGLVSASVSTLLFGLVTVGGLGLVAYAVRHREDFAELDLKRHRETVLSINTIDGETVHVAVDTDTNFDRELSTCVHQRDVAPVDVPVVRSPSD